MFDATKYSARFSSAATGNSIYLYIPINFVSGNTYTITFYTKRVCSVTINTNELPNQTTLLTTETQTNASCNSNWNTWYQWSTTLLSNYTGAGYFQIWTKTIYGGPTSVYLDDVSIFESEPVNLPIELLYFQAKNWGINNKLIWSTASQYNNDFFTIEKSEDGIFFDEIIRVKGAGNSAHQLFYSEYDYDVNPGINYYRLKQTDYDGRYEIFDIVSVDNTDNAPKSKEVKAFNIVGQEVDLKTYNGEVLIMYEDGSVKKMTLRNE